MKSYRQPKRKRVEICRLKDECAGVTVKKSANGTVHGHNKATESIRMPNSEPPIELQIPSAKIKLQLFPINEQTRLGLEKDGHNPFLELTLSARKRISSVVKHLNTKWGSSSKVVGQLMLFPYNMNLEQLASCRRWTSNDSAITAWEAYVDVGCPSIFRLRYGWLSNLPPEMFDVPLKFGREAHTGPGSSRKGWPINFEFPNHQEKQINESCETAETQINGNEALDPDANELKGSDEPTNFVDEDGNIEVDKVRTTVPWDDNLTNLSIGGLLSEISLQGKIDGSDSTFVNKSGMQPIGVVSDVSVGDLLSEASLLGKMSNPLKLENESSLQPIILSPSDVSIGGLLSEASLLSNKDKLDTRTTVAGLAQFQSPWSDTFTTLSIGGLLSEASLQARAGGIQELKESKSSLEPNTSFSRSFGSLISSHLLSHSQMPKPSCHEPCLSILDAEETCHAFPIQKLQSGNTTASNTRASSSGCNNRASSKQSQFPEIAKMNNETVFPRDSSSHELKKYTLPHPVGASDEDIILWSARHQPE